MWRLREELELRRKNEVHEVEERKNEQIKKLMVNHEKQFSDIKNYYNDITHNNLCLITTLKEKVELSLASLEQLVIRDSIGRGDEEEGGASREGTE